MQDELLDELGKLFAAAHNAQEIRVLLNGLLTPGEIEEITFRWRLMTRLIRGETQRDISRDLGVSLGKISRGSRLLKYGPPEFRTMIQGLAEPAAKRDGAGPE